MNQAATKSKPKIPANSNLAISHAPSETPQVVHDFISQAQSYLDEDDIAELLEAYKLGAWAHRNQTRRSGEPYITHPLQVAVLLADFHLDKATLIAAILHDTVEDTELSHQDIESRFSKEVADLVEGVTKIGQIEFETKEHAEAENIRKMLLAMSRDIRVMLIKLADRLHNVRTLDSMPRNKQIRIAGQTLDIFAPIANRLGLNQWANELQDLSFKTLYPKRYEKLVKTLDRKQGNRKAVLTKIKASIKEHLKATGIGARVNGRKKNVYSIYRKMQKKQVSLDEIRDIYGLRIIVDKREECYLTLGAIHSLYKPVANRFKDYIAIPKINGYQSLHTTVFGNFGELLEIQIRTEQMHHLSESGVAAHWYYKTFGGENTIAPQEHARQWLVDLLDTQKQAGNPSEFLEHLKVDLFPDEVYVFTPKGDIVKLPQGATALDFAYSIHSEIGNSCVGVEVNGTLVPLYTQLTSGDHIKVHTDKTSHPSPTWLNYVKTAKARASLRSFLRGNERTDSVRLGQKLLERELREEGLSLDAITDERKQALLQRIELKDWNDLLSDVGQGKRLPLVVMHQLIDDACGMRLKAEPSPLTIEGSEGVMVNFARCCHPIPGDGILGYFAEGKGVVIHTQSCPNRTQYNKHPEKWIPVSWANGIDKNFPVTLRIDTKNKPGVLASLATTIAENNSNINTVSVEERDGKFSIIRFTIEVENRIHLARIMRKVRSLEGVLKISRVKG